MSTSDMPALPDVRRVVTGHNDAGIAVVRIQDTVAPKESPAFPGISGHQLWLTDDVPTDDNNSEVDGITRTADRDLGLVINGGSNLRYTDLAPGARAPMHRTSSLDYNVLVQGKIILEMEDGSETLVENPGDVVIQRGTIHAWRNAGPGWTRFVTVIIDAKPAVVGDRILGVEVRS
ncbi:cupin domain protein [Daedalea quercina L-15889]|uniref:Cupin domain protein n=1 Tax=Daedalea quercina L-15889 TaxID=1314783 RepID=A0A165T2S8_9APHY|nr:cupin domain protein [Daedalea quercina L-15889]